MSFDRFKALCPYLWGSGHPLEEIVLASSEQIKQSFRVGSKCSSNGYRFDVSYFCLHFLHYSWCRKRSGRSRGVAGIVGSRRSGAARFTADCEILAVGIDNRRGEFCELGFQCCRKARLGDSKEGFNGGRGLCGDSPVVLGCKDGT